MKYYFQTLIFGLALFLKTLNLTCLFKKISASLHTRTVKLLYPLKRCCEGIKIHKAVSEQKLYMCSYTNACLSAIPPTFFNNIHNKVQKDIEHASKIWLQNGTKNNNTTSNMPLDHCNAFSLLLKPSDLKKKFVKGRAPQWTNLSPPWIHPWADLFQRQQY